MGLTLDQALQKGIEAHKARKVQEADRYYTAVLKANPKHPDANHNMGVIAVSVGKVESALPFFKIALEVNPSVAQYWLSYIDALIKLDRVVDAKAVFEQAKGNGANGNGFDQIEKLLGSLNSAVLNVQEPPSDQLKSLFNLYKKGQYREALTKASPLLKQFPNSINLYNIIGATNQNLGKLEEAIYAFNKAVSLKPDYADAYYNIGIVLQDQGKLDEALEAYNKAISLKPDYADAYYNMGIVLQDQGKLGEAVDAYSEALSLKPDFVGAYNNLGNVLKDQGKLDEAIEAYNKALSIKPDNADAYNNLGNALKAQGKLDEAIEAYNKAVFFKPDYADAYYNMGIVLQDQGKLDESVNAFSKTVSLKPDNADAYNNLGNALKTQGKLDEAIEAYNKALSIKPDNVDAYNNLGNALKTQGKLDEAIDAYSKALSIQPDCAEAYNNMGIVLKDQGNLDDAVNAFSKAISLKSDYAEGWNNLYFPLSVKKTKISPNKNINSFYPKDIESNYAKIELDILDYKLHRGQNNEGIYLDKAISRLSSAGTRVIPNPKFDKNPKEKIPESPDKMVALIHFGRSGTGLMHSLIDGHPEVSTLPSIYFSEYFNYSTWEKIISNGWTRMVDQFTEIYDVLFDATSSKPVEAKSKKLIYNIGVREGMANVGDQRNEVLKVDKDLFRIELKRLMAFYDELDAFVFFKLVHTAYNRVLNDFNSKSLIFYHIHNPDTCAELNFSRLNPNGNWLMMVREPIQSCESWVRMPFHENDYFGVVNLISTMLFEIDNFIYSRQNAIGVRLEDLKEQPHKTIPALCNWMGIKESESLYEMTAQGKKWWGDPNSLDYSKDGMEPFGKTSINRKIGSIFSENDQFILRTLFYPFSVRFGYTKENEEQFKSDLDIIGPMLDNLFDFERAIAEKMQMSCKKLIGSGSYLYLRSRLIERWNILNKHQTYPNMIEALRI